MAGLLDDIMSGQDGGGLLGGLPATWQYTNPEDLTPKQKELMALVGTQNADQAGFAPLPASNTPFPTSGAAPMFGMGAPGATPGNPSLPPAMTPATPAPAPFINPNPMTNQSSAAPAAGAPGAPSPPISMDYPTMPGVPAAAPAPAAPAAASAAVPAFGAGASPVLFANRPGSTPGNPALMAPPSPTTAPPVVAADDDDDDTPAAPAAAPGQNAPIGVGGYQMPRIGGGFSAPAAAAPSAPVTLPGATPAAPGAGDNLMAAYQNLRHGGGLLGSIVTAVTGKRNDAYGEAQQQQAQTANLTARALLSQGVNPQMVAAAVQPGNGELLKALFTQMATQGSHSQETDADGNVWDVNKQTGQRTLSLAAKDDKYQHVLVKNPDGSESLRSFNTKTGQWDAAPQSSTLKSAIDPDSTGAERMAQLQAADPNYARKVQAAVNGDMPLPTQGQAARSPQANRFIEDVLAVDGSTSASDFNTRAVTRKDYASGMASRVTKSLNTTIEHAANLDAAIDKLGNHSYFPGMTNWLHDKWSNNTDPEYQKARSQFESAKEAFVKELDFTLSGGHSSVSGSAELRDKINRADSPEALHAAVQEDLHLLSARLDSHAKGFSEGTRSQRDGQDFLYPKNKATFNRLMGSEDTSTGQPVPGVANMPAPSAPSPSPTTAPVPALKVGQSATFGNVTIKKIKAND